MIRSSIEAVKNEQRRNYAVARFLESCKNVSGSLFVEKRNEQKYYKRKYYENGIQHTDYLGKVNDTATKEFVGAKFRQAFLTVVKKNIDAIELFTHSYVPVTLNAVYGELDPIYREVSIDFFLDERLEAIKEWAHADYPKNPAPIKKPNIACDGTITRSKGECIWYNLLISAGLPFRYDCAVKVIDDLGRERWRYIDFLILCCDGTLIGIEHLGMLQDPTYGIEFSMKLREYQRVGFVSGSTLFITSDNEDSTVDSRAIKELVGLLTERFYRV